MKIIKLNKETLYKFYYKLNLEDNDINPFQKLYFVSFSIGWFVAFYSTAAFSSFLKYHKPESLGLAYLVSGLIGFVLSVIIGKLKLKFSIKTVNNILVTTVLILTLIAQLGFWVSAGNISILKIVSFYTFALAAPLSIMLGGMFANQMLNIFNPEQSKKMFALVNTGEILASAFGFFTVPLILKIIGGSQNLIILSVIGIIESIVPFSILKKHDLSARKTFWKSF